MPTAAASFIHQLRYADIPEPARRAARRLLLDTLGTAAAGTTTRVSRILRDHAARFHAAGCKAPGARLMFDGRRVAPQGAAMAGAGTIDSIDAHDGHRLTKGHAGVTVLPSLLALSDEMAPCDGEEFLTRLVLGYEIATRAGIALHATVPDYHTSGAWNALGAAALASRAMTLGEAATHHALGIAEYYGPRSQMMRVIEYPTMLKDGSTMGALSGVSAALLAAEGFTGAPAITIAGEDVAAVWEDLGARWRIEEQYIKAYPVCRWAQPAIEAVLGLKRSHGFAAAEVAGVTIHSFAEAVRLATHRPADTDAAQYSLPFSVAAALMHGKLGIGEIDGAGLLDPQVLALSDKMVLVEDETYKARFPAERWAHAEIALTDGRLLRSPPCVAKGDPEAPFSDAELEQKFRQLSASLLNGETCAALIAGCRSIDGATDCRAFVDTLLSPPAGHDAAKAATPAA